MLHKWRIRGTCVESTRCIIQLRALCFQSIRYFCSKDTLTNRKVDLLDSTERCLKLVQVQPSLKSAATLYKLLVLRA